MSDILQWVIIALAVAAAVIYLTRKMRREASGKCDGCCEKCSMGAEFVEKCLEKPSADPGKHVRY